MLCPVSEEIKNLNDALKRQVWSPGLCIDSVTKQIDDNFRKMKNSINQQYVNNHIEDLRNLREEEKRKDLERENEYNEFLLQVKTYESIEQLNKTMLNIQKQLENLSVWIERKFEENRRSAQNDCDTL